MAAALVQVSINLSTLNKSHHVPSNKSVFWRLKSLQPIKCHNISRAKGEYLCKSRFNKRVSEEDRFSFLGGSSKHKDGILLRGDLWKRSCKRVVLTRSKDNFGFNGLDGGRRGGTASRVLGILAMIFGAYYYVLVTGNAGLVLKILGYIWLAVVLSIFLFIGALMWFTGRDFVEGSCPSCGDFVLIDSTHDGKCPFCSQPLSGKECFRDPMKISELLTRLSDAPSGFSSRRMSKGKDPEGAVDVDAEVKDED